jgi:hypothetical protein
LLDPEQRGEEGLDVKAPRGATDLRVAASVNKPREAEADGFEWSDFVADFSREKVVISAGRNRAARPRS